MRTQPHLQTFRLWLEPDKDIPQFQRISWENTGVSIKDVLLHGIHPWMGANVHYTLPDAFLQRINQPEAKLAELQEFGYGNEVSVGYGHAWEKNIRFERALETVRNDLCFVENLSLVELLEIAKNRLRENWRHSMVKELVRAAFPSFQEIRSFLKEKDKTLKLTSYENIDQYDLSRIFTLDDFCHKDRLLILYGIPTLNFRKASFLKTLTDDQGRLKLAHEIKDITLTETEGSPDYAHVVWHATRKGNILRFRPDIDDSRAKRRHIMEFAKRWRIDDGRLCFHTSIDQLTEMIEHKAVEPSFPSLNYNHPQEGPTASVTVNASRIQVFHIGHFANHNATGEALKEVLHQYDVSMTGNKDQLIEKLATLAGKKYREKLVELDQFFTGCRVVRMQSAPTGAVEFPVLEELAYLRNLLLTMYTIKHLRGSAILEPAHKNETYTEDELALALLTGKVSLPGAFLRIV